MDHSNTSSASKTSTAEESNQDIERSRNSAFSRVRRIPNPNYNPEDETLFSDIEQLPQAYPVADLTLTHDTPSDYDYDHGSLGSIESPDSTSNNENETNKKWINLIFKGALGIFLIAVTVLLIAMYDSPVLPATVGISDKNINGTTTTTTTTKHDIIDLDASEINISEKNEKSSFEETHQQFNQSQVNISCYTDPMVIQLLEWEAHEKGDDPSIPRTYHFCPNTVMNVYNLDPVMYNFDFSSGSFHPLLLFRPNVNILCGFDGDYSNNCTFQGGFVQFILHYRPFTVSYNLNTTAENITIQGFRFTGATEGVNIACRSYVTGLTLKNCRFDNNNNMISSIHPTSINTVSSILHVHNTTFENNSYTPNPNTYTDGPHVGGFLRRIPNVGAITAFPNPTSKAVVRVNVSDCVFENNTFLIDSTTGAETGAVINLLPPVSSVQITNSCFSGNVGYSSSLILLGSSSVGREEMISEDYNGNHFSSNEQDGIYEQSCILNYQMLSLDAGGIVEVTPKVGCGDYIDLSYNESESSGVCLI